MSSFCRHPRSGRSARLRALTCRTRRLGLAVLVAASLACSGSESTGPDPIEGTYTLQTMGGRPLPVLVIQDEDGSIEITAGSVTLRAPNGFTMALSFRQTSGTRVSTVTDQVDGTWTRSGSTVTLTADGEAVSATLSDGTLRMVGEAEDLGMVEWVFRK